MEIIFLYDWKWVGNFGYLRFFYWKEFDVGEGKVEVGWFVLERVRIKLFWEV